MWTKRLATNRFKQHLKEAYQNYNDLKKCILNNPLEEQKEAINNEIKRLENYKNFQKITITLFTNSFLKEQKELYQKLSDIKNIERLKPYLNHEKEVYLEFIDAKKYYEKK